MQKDDQNKRGEHDLGGKTAEPTKSNAMRSPAMRIVMGIVGFVVMICGLLQMYSGIKEMSSGGLPSVSDRQAVVDKSLASMTEFQDAKSGFSMSYPSNWTRTEKVNESMILKVAVYEGTINVSATAEDESKELTSTQYAQLTDEMIGKSIGKMGLEKVSEDDISLNGTPGRKRIHVLTTQSDGKDVRVKQVMILAAKNGKGYSMTASAIEDWYPQFEPVINKMIESIKIKD